MNGKKVVVTGGAGFIGSNLVRALTENNELVILDDLSTGNLENINDLVNTKKVNFIKGSVTDLDLLQKLFIDIDYVFHQAAIPSVPRSIKDPVRVNHVNVTGTLNVLIAARDNMIKKLVYASSSSVYGDTPVLPKEESMRLSPMSPYAVSKLVGEYYCRLFNEIYGLQTVALRYFNVYGPYQNPNGEYAAVVPRFITKILNTESPIIYGDGKQTRDFTFVRDVINANILSTKEKIVGTFNIAGGKRVTINRLAKLIMNIANKDIDIMYDEPRSGDIFHSHADISKSKEFEYKPRYSLEQGLKETIKWYYDK
jgi:UDP-glucose 4-epimerase